MGIDENKSLYLLDAVWYSPISLMYPVFQFLQVEFGIDPPHAKEFISIVPSLAFYLTH